MPIDSRRLVTDVTVLTALLVAPLAVRVLLLVDGGIVPKGADLVGFTTDMSLALLLGAVLAWLGGRGRNTRFAAAFAAAMWSLVNFANYEHVRELGSTAGLAHAGYLFDPTFFSGSVLAPNHPVAVIGTTVASGALLLYASGRRWAPHLRALAVAGAMLFVVSAFSPRTPTVASWRQTNFVSNQVAQLFERQTIGYSLDPVAGGGLAIRDLRAPMIIAEQPSPRNVLLVILEGVSGAYLPLLREAHGFPSLIDMPELDAVAREGLAYPTFITTQRQTNRGEYALLCGDYPKLITSEAKMTELVGAGPLVCLPRVLREAGFTTVYIQASPMPFMLKDQFMPQAGFEETHGTEYFQSAYNRNHWGVDDRTLFERAREAIGELNTRGKPWFLTLLTVGTHHRYNVPPAFKGNHDPGSTAWAFEYLDHAVGDFVRNLRTDGVLENTVVIITSDESQAMIAGAPDMVNTLTQGWGFLIVLLPSHDRGVVGDIFIQPDIPLSLIDLLNLENGRRQFAGRSVFRRYDHTRDLFWGNTHLRTVAGLTRDRELVVCTESFDSCAAWDQVGDHPFAPPAAPRPARPAEISWLRDAAEESLVTEIRAQEKRRISLVASERHAVTTSTDEQYVFGGQFLSIPAHSSANVVIDVEVTGSRGRLELVNNFVVNLQPIHTRSARVEVGQTLRIRYAVNTEYDLKNVECRLWVTVAEGESLGLEFRSAEVEIVPLTTREPMPQVIEREFQVLSHPPT